MTRKDYNALAGDLAIEYRHMGEAARAGFRSAVETLTVVLKRDNPRFDRERFLTACGID